MRMIGCGPSELQMVFFFFFLSAREPRCQDSACVEVQPCNRTHCNQAGTHTHTSRLKAGVKVHVDKDSVPQIGDTLCRTLCFCLLEIRPWAGSEAEQPGSVCLPLSWSIRQHVDVSLSLTPHTHTHKHKRRQTQTHKKTLPCFCHDLL